MQFDENSNVIISEDAFMVHTVSCDEKPGIQAIATTGDDLRPTAKTGCVYRDAEYKRLGTLSLLAGIDLLTGIAIPVVSETHKSSDFITLLKKLGVLYPEGDIIRIVCDNHSAHKSKETRNYLATQPEGRFVFVFTPKHGIWLDMAEIEIGIMNRQSFGKPCADLESFRQQVRAWTIKSNTKCVKINWQFKTQDAKIKLARLYPNIV